MGRRRRRIQKPVEQRERSMGDDINMTWKNSSEDKSTEGVHPQEDDALAQTEEAPIQAAENLSGVEEPHGEITEAAAIDLSGKQTIPPNSVCFPESNTVLSSMESPLHSNCKDICKNIEQIIADIPSIDLNSEVISLDFLVTGGSTPARIYNLRSLSKKTDPSPDLGDPVGGLGPSSSKPSQNKGRGRKSELSKAQVKAKLDVADGKQRLISGVLRAAKPPEAVIK